MRIARRNVATRDGGGNVSFSILSGDTNLFEVDVAPRCRIPNLGSCLHATVDPGSALVARERLVDQAPLSGRLLQAAGA
ncbi:MAG: hypothetical protein OXI15_11590 [Chromatiales bacterium]|nr:hypothetical protein [Chromatiales bacterium]